MDKIHKSLAHYGLSDNQIQVYLVVLKLHSVPASTIARHTGIKRVTVYTVLESLLKKWLVTEHLAGESKYFSATHPEQFVQEQEAQLAQLQETLPDLVALMGDYNNKPQVQYFEGVQWLIRLYEDFFTTDESIRSFLGISPSMNTEIKDYLNDTFLPRRLKQSIWAKVILSQNSHNQNIYKPFKNWLTANKELLTEMLVIDNDVFSLANEINLYWPNKVSVVLYNEGELSWFIIQSKILYQSLSSIFDLVWLLWTKNGNKKK